MAKWLRKAIIIQLTLGDLSKANCTALRYCGLWTIDRGLKKLWTIDYGLES